MKEKDEEGGGKFYILIWTCFISVRLLPYLLVCPCNERGTKCSEWMVGWLVGSIRKGERDTGRKEIKLKKEGNKGFNYSIDLWSCRALYSHLCICNCLK
jgi:hypothetical protein